MFSVFLFQFMTNSDEDRVHEDDRNRSKAQVISRRNDTNDGVDNIIDDVIEDILHDIIDDIIDDVIEDTLDDIIDDVIEYILDDIIDYMIYDVCWWTSVLGVSQL